MEQKRGLLAAIVVFLLGIGPLFAQSIEPRLVPTPFAVELGKAPTPLSVSMLIEASLELSGADPATMAADTKRLDAIVAEAKKAVAGYSTDYAKGDALLVFMHRQVLTRYSDTQTRLDTLLRTGEFNCVSSAVLYMILGRAVGLNVEAVYTPDHAFCTVRAKGRLIDVETTNQYGFDPGTKTKFRDAFGNTGFTYVPPGDYRLRTPTDGKGLLSFILQNRMSLLERQYRFAQAVGLATDRYAILRNKGALGDLVSEIGNYCALLNQRTEYSTAIAFLDRVQKDYGRLPKLGNIMSGLIHNEVLQLSKAGEYGKALILIDKRSTSGDLDAQSVASLKKLVVQNRLAQAVSGSPFANALAEIENSYRGGSIDQSEYHRYLVALFGKEAQQTAATKGYLSAVKVLDQGIKLTGGNAELERGRGIYLNNYIAAIHNHFATLFNNREYGQATKVIQEGLAVVPGSSVLNQDLQLIRRTSGG